MRSVSRRKILVDWSDELVLVIYDSMVLRNRLTSLEGALLLWLTAATLHKHHCQQDDHQTATQTDQNPYPITQTFLSVAPRILTTL